MMGCCTITTAEKGGRVIMLHLVPHGVFLLPERCKSILRRCSIKKSKNKEKMVLCTVITCRSLSGSTISKKIACCKSSPPLTLNLMTNGFLAQNIKRISICPVLACHAVVSPNFKINSLFFRAPGVPLAIITLIQCGLTSALLGVGTAK